MNKVHESVLADISKVKLKEGESLKSRLSSEEKEVLQTAGQVLAKLQSTVDEGDPAREELEGAIRVIDNIMYDEYFG